jgi:hypothetical protein
VRYAMLAHPLCGFEPCPLFSPRERVGAKLEVHDDRLLAFTAFHGPRRPVAARRPQSPTLTASSWDRAW